METKNGYFIEVTSPYKEFWRYNVAIMCGAFSAQGERTGFTSTEDHIADVGNASPGRPASYPPQRKVTLEAPEADYLILYIYIIPHTLPTGTDIATIAPFPLEINVRSASKSFHHQTRQINQWSGTSIELRVDTQIL